MARLYVDYRLVLICSNEDEEMSHFISKLHLSRRVFMPQSGVGQITYKSYLASKFTVGGDCPASTVDHEKYVMCSTLYILLCPLDC